MPNARFLHNMGTASIIAGAILLGLSWIVGHKRSVRRAVHKVK